MSPWALQQRKETSFFLFVADLVTISNLTPERFHNIQVSV